MKYILDNIFYININSYLSILLFCLYRSSTYDFIVYRGLNLFSCFKELVNASAQFYFFVNFRGSCKSYTVSDDPPPINVCLYAYIVIRLYKSSLIYIEAGYIRQCLYKSSLIYIIYSGGYAA